MGGPLPTGDPVPVSGELAAACVAEAVARPLSVYVHVPFCASRCGYCDFNTYTDAELGPTSLRERYLAAAQGEIDLAARVLGGRWEGASTVYFGGGTPTLLAIEELSGLLAHVRERLGLTDGAEVTTEANPESVDATYFARLRDAGFTRVSLGMQSSALHVLAALERQHTPDRALRCVEWAREAGFEHVGLDLIYGTPGESLDDWRTSLEAATSVDVDHVSAYALIVEDGTRLGGQVARGEKPMPDDDDLADKYLLAEELLTTRGLDWYEISNWARPGGECRHNLAYWRGDPWWGIGPGAHSHVGGYRWWNVKHPRSYAERLEVGVSPGYASETLSAEDRRVERVLLELRLRDGLPLEVMTSSERRRVAQVVADGLVVPLGGDRIRLTVPGRLLADAVVRDLLD